MIQIETYMQVIIEVQVTEPCDTAMALQEEQVIRGARGGRGARNPCGYGGQPQRGHAPARPGILHGVRSPPVPPPGHLPNPGGPQGPGGGRAPPPGPLGGGAPPLPNPGGPQGPGGGGGPPGPPGIGPGGGPQAHQVDGK